MKDTTVNLRMLKEAFVLDWIFTNTTGKNDGHFLIKDILKGLGRCDSINKVTFVKINNKLKNIKITYGLVRELLVELQILYIDGRTKNIEMYKKKVFVKEKSFILMSGRIIKGETNDERLVLKYIRDNETRAGLPRYIKVTRMTGVKRSVVREIYVKHGIDMVVYTDDVNCVFVVPMNYRNVNKMVLKGNLINICKYTMSRYTMSASSKIYNYIVRL